MKINDGNQQWHFDFKDWREAFDTFYRWKAKDVAFRFVIEESSYASGYWIERGATASKTTHVYRSVKAVKALEARISRIRESRNSLSLGRLIF